MYGRVKEHYAVRRLREYVNTECCMFLLKSYIVSKMYCCAVWHYTNKTNTLKIENVLKKGLRIIFQDYNSTYKVLLHKANLTELHTASQNVILTNIYKILSGLSLGYLLDFF